MTPLRTDVAPEYLVIRYATYMNGNDVMDAHLATLRQKGIVTFAKIGKPIGLNRIKEVNERNKAGEQVNGYLVSQMSGARLVYRIRIRGATGLWKSELLITAPEYYQNIEIRRISKSWLLIDEINEESQFRRGWFRTQSGGDLVDALDRSTAGVFMARRIPPSPGL